jgi:hypothetical protein
MKKGAAPAGPLYSSVFGGSLSFQYTYKEKKYYGTRKGHNKGTHKAHGVDPYGAEDDPADEGSDHTDPDIAKEAKTSALPHLSRQPSGNCTC